MGNDSSVKAARLAEAAYFIRRGWAVLIDHDVSAGRCSCAEGPSCRTPGKHPREGGWQNNPLRDVDEVAQRLERWPEANLGIATGPASGFWALDVDPKNGGDVALAELERTHGPLPYTQVHRTGSGGEHRLFELPPDFTPTNANRLPGGLDVRGAGGQIVAPGSYTDLGPYTVRVEAPTLAQAPAWLLDFIRPQVVREPVHGLSTGAGGGYEFAGQALSTAGPQDPRLAAYARRAVGLELAALADTPLGRGTRAVQAAYALIELCNSPWAALDVESVHAAYLDACRTAMTYGGRFDEAEAVGAWNSAAKKVGWRGREVPPERELIGAVDVPDFSVPGVLGLTIPAPRAEMDAPGTAGLVGVLDNPWTTRGQSLTWENAPVDQSRGQAVDQAWTPTDFDMEDPAMRALVAREVRAQLVKAEAKRLMVAAAGDGGALERLRAALLDATELGNIPANAPLVKGWLVKDSLARLSGPSGVGKSFVMIDLAGCVGGGIAWHGNRVEQGRVVYVVAEGVGGVDARRRAWEKAYGRTMTGVTFLPLPVQVSEPEWDAFTALMEEVKPTLVIVDTQARVTVGMRENDPTEMGQFVHALDRLRLATGACVLVVHHTGVDGDRARGATSVKGALQTELMVTRGEGGRELLVRQDKQKDGVELPDLRLGMRYMDLGLDSDGEPTGSLALTRTMDIVGGRRTNADLINEIMREVFSRGNGGTTAQVYGVTCGERKLMKKSAFFKAWGELVEAGNVGQIRGTAYWRHVPMDMRDKLTEPLAKGKGFVLPDELN